MSIKNIKRVFKVIKNNLFTVNATLSYDRVNDAILLLCDLINSYDDDTEDLWYLGETDIMLADLVVGAYWHYYEWHGGQYSKSYQCLCALGNIFSPGCSEIDQDNFGEYETYLALEQLAKNV